MLRIIVNPVAGNGRSLRLLGDALSALKSHSLDCEVKKTCQPGHAIQLAREALDAKMDGLVVIGGDGTLFEVVNGLDGRWATVYFVPSGTGNDFVKALKLPKDPIKALHCQLKSPERRLDVAQVNGYCYLNVAGTGFDIEVLRQTEKFKTRFSGLIAYALGLWQAIRHFEPVEARITIDGETIEKNFTLIEMANGNTFGGGMRVAPRADPGDGLLDVVCVDAIKRWQIALLAPLFITGWFVHLPIVRTARAREVVLEAEGMVLNLDGELRAMDTARFTLRPGCLSAHCPPMAPIRSRQALPISQRAELP